MVQMNSSGWLPDKEFAKAVNALPLVSVDLVLVNKAGQMLLGLRRNAPARHWWFTPGGRVHKNEPYEACLLRVAMGELGLQEQDVQGAQLMGVWDHFYEDSACSPEVSTHYVNLPHVLQLKQPLELDALPDDQHSGWRWQDAKDVVIADDVHPYVRVYGQWLVENSYSP